MRVTVSVVGGLFDDDRVLSLDDNELTVTEDGRISANRHVTASDAGHVRDLAHQVAGLSIPEPGRTDAVDGGSTTIEIAGDDVHQRIVLCAGDDAPEPVWALLDTVEALSRRDVGPSKGSA